MPGNRQITHEIPLQDLTDDALIDWFAVAVSEGQEWADYRAEIKRRINAEGEQKPGKSILNGH